LGRYIDKIALTQDGLASRLCVYDSEMCSTR
jgi:hypothetical protein